MAHVTLYTKQDCPYSQAARMLLRDQGIGFEDIDVTEDESLFAKMVERSGGHTTVPQVFIAGRHIGGFADLARFQQQGGFGSFPGAQPGIPSPS
ncbi:glutaredoxin 3 [Cystobacter fuscus]|uniref:glutaredoxin 3 n=1 Tax=Cystobacter fuscus TaxID=43 RepID=UPI002B2C782E|nr:glutaredoxin 3 [Cystobacter fuscus]